MRLKSLIVAAVAVSAVGLAAPNPASAGGFHHHRGSGDPYAYVPEVPRYYAYRNSGYCRPAEDMRYRYRYDYKLPPYAKAWGWNSRAWYLENQERRRDWRR